jgi:hypothetical protein
VVFGEGFMDLKNKLLLGLLFFSLASPAMENGIKDLRDLYVEFQKTFDSSPSVAQIQQFLKPFVEQWQNRYAANEISHSKELVYTFDFYAPAKNQERQYWKRIYCATRRFLPKEGSSAYSLGAYDCNWFHSDKFFKNISGIQLIMIPIGEKLLIIDLFSMCGTEILDPELPIKDILEKQKQRCPSEAIWVSDSKVALRLGTSKLEITPIIEDESTAEEEAQ